MTAELRVDSTVLPTTRPLPSELVLLHGATPASLVARARSLNGDLPAVAMRSQLAFDATAPERLAVVAADLDDLRSKVDHFARHQRPAPGVHHVSGVVDVGDVAFLFPGQGSQYVGMGADVAAAFPPCGAVWERLAGRSLPSIVRSGPENRLTDTQRAQPALALTSLALLEVLDGLAVRASCAAGHSFGELVALHYAGVLSAADLVAVARRRGQLMNEAAVVPGGMLAVTASRAQVDTAMTGRTDCWVANHNAPDEVIISGAFAGLAAAQRALARFPVRPLVAAAAFHSPLVAAARAPLADFVATLDIRPCLLPVYGNADAATYPTGPAEIRARIAQQLTSPVRFADQITTMYAAGVRTFVEVGAGTTLTRLTSRVLGSLPHLAVSLDRKGHNGVTALQEALGALAVAGVGMDLSAWWQQ